MTSHRFSQIVQRLAVREWLTILTCLLVLACELGWQNGLGRLDQTLYDAFTSLNSRPAREDIIIVAIDDYSLAQLGRWPWPRKLHAQLLDRLTKAGPRAIGLDVILTEPERTSTDGKRDGDAAMATALASSRKTVLPIVVANSGAGMAATTPIADIAGKARALGHINLEHDNDGVVRSVYLHEGQQGIWWPHFALALANAGGADIAGKFIPQAGEQQRPGNWLRTREMHIPFSGGNGHFRSIPYVAVLNGEVPAQFFADKYVLVGATAIGMTDSYPTPVSGQDGAMPGVEIHANILASLLDNKSVSFAQPWQTALFSFIPVFIALLIYVLLPLRVSLPATAALLLGTLFASYVALYNGLWLPPSAALIVLMISYPLWSWRRLEAVIAYLGQEFMRLDKEPHLLPEVGAPAAAPAGVIEDVLEQRMNAMKTAARRVRDLRQFISDSLDSLPDATLVTTVDGHVLLANKHANTLFTSLGFQDLQGALLPYLFSTLNQVEPINQNIAKNFDWWHLLDIQYAAVLTNGISVQDPHGSDLLIKSAPCRSAANVLTGWIVSIIDISPIRAAERSRDETLRFLSHDMRGPQASIIALLELQNDPATALPLDELFARIEKASRKTLGLADNFVQLARAESQEYRLEEVNFQDLVFDATDEMWSLAKSKRIELVSDIAPNDYPIKADRSLLTRALVNLLSNAINYSPEGTRVNCKVEFHPGLETSHIVCSISDQGYGIAPADQIKLFRRFQRLETANQPHHEGIGLGLVFVKTVIERHHGQIGFSSKVGTGTIFTLTLPATRGQGN